jgi:hypothetical protein
MPSYFIKYEKSETEVYTEEPISTSPSYSIEPINPSYRMLYSFDSSQCPQLLLRVQEKVKNFTNFHVTVTAYQKSESAQKGNYICTTHIATSDSLLLNSFVYLLV